MVEDTWFARELPVLETIIETLKERGPYGRVSIGDVAESLSWDPMQVYAAVHALGEEFVRVRTFLIGGDPRSYVIKEVTQAARRVVGQWPPESTIIDRLLEGP